MDGAGFTRLSRSAGTHRAVFNPGCTRYADTWSAVATPPQARLHDAEGAARMRAAGRLAAQILDEVAGFVRAGVTTAEIDRLCSKEKYLKLGFSMKTPGLRMSLL